MGGRPDQWGKYELVERLGRGGMGEVWKARISGVAGFSRTLVVKRLLPHLLEDQRFVEMFLTEARLSAQLEHPNIVQIFELGDVNGEFFLAMEYVHGRDLARVISQFAQLGQRPPVPLSVYVTREVCRALSYAHQLTDKHGARLGLIHRDVSPSNVMLALNGAVKLLDFGVAKAAAESHNQATQTGVLKGKLWYMAPERVDGKSFDQRSDIFSTGVVLYEALTATRLFEAQNPAKVINLICNKPIEPPSRINPEVPLELDRICLRALARDPRLRYAAADEMANELDELSFKMRWGAEHTARLLQDTFSLGTHVELGALEASTHDDASPAAAATQHAKGRATPSGRTPPSRQTTAPVPREASGVIDDDRTVATLAPALPPSSAATQPNPVIDDEDAGTVQTSLPEAEPPQHSSVQQVALPPGEPVSFDDATRVAPVTPPSVTQADTLFYRRVTQWRWPLAVAASAIVLALAIVIGQASSRGRGRGAAADEVVVTVTSDPSDAQAVVDGATRVVGRTPFTAHLPRGDGYVLEVSHRGYEPYSMPMSTEKDLRLHVVLKPLR